jgi:hypothetical protein
MNLLQRNFLKVSLTVLIPLFSSTGDIHLNQIGYYPDDKKIAIAVGAQSDSFSIVDVQTNTVLFKDACISGGIWDASEESTLVADFSVLRNRVSTGLK